MPRIATEGRLPHAVYICTGKGKYSRLQSWLLTECYNLLLSKHIFKLRSKILDAQTDLTLKRTTVDLFFIRK